MKLSFPFLQQKKDSPVYYLALLLTSEKASAIILEESEGKIKIINKQNQSFIENIENLSLEELIDTTDKVISSAEETLPPSIEIRKTVFGVKENWVESENKKIKKIYLQKLKKLCDALDLSPIGFMVVSEAISSLCQQEEGAPLSAIFVELGKKTITLTLFRGGKSIQVVDGVMEGTYASTVDNLLKHFTIEVLPARIILYDTQISEDLIQQFITHQWTKSLPFLHMPQISVLDSGFDGRAVAFGAAAQMGFEVLDSKGSDIKTYTSGGKEDKPAPESAVSSSIPSVDFGFVVGEDIAKQLSDPNPAEVSAMQEVESNVTESQQEEILREENNPAPKKKIAFPSVRLPKVSLPSFDPKGPKILLIPVAILIFAVSIIGGAYYFYLNNVNASVLITLNPKKVTQTNDVIFTIENSGDYSKNVLGAKTVNSTLDGDLSVGATGKKEIGDKAKGTVTIYSKLSRSKTFTSGTIITYNGHDFTLDKDVVIASSSGDASDEPSKASVPVTAKDIGTDSNLPSGLKFAVSGFDQSEVVAKNESAFSGGTKKTVTVASKDDLAKLRAELVKNLEEKASEELVKQAEPDSITLPIVLSTNIEKTKYDKEAGDEAKTVKLNATVSFTGLSYQESETKKFAKEIIQKNYSKNLTFDEKNIQTKIVDAKQKSPKEVMASLVINASLLPKIDNQEIAKELRGKSGKEADAIISRIPQLERSEIHYSPNIFFLSKMLPRLPNHVTVNVSSN